MAKKRKAKRAAKKIARKAPKKTARQAYDPQTGRLSGRAVKAKARLDELTEKYIREGMDPGSAKQRATDEMRDNPRRDWRDG
jgi:N-acetylglutamate synthase/N-acetylornithine aminotransferase